jgi:hypothetical protein
LEQIRNRDERTKSRGTHVFSGSLQLVKKGSGENMFPFVPLKQMTCSTIDFIDPMINRIFLKTRIFSNLGTNRSIYNGMVMASNTSVGSPQ